MGLGSLPIPNASTLIIPGATTLVIPARQINIHVALVDLYGAPILLLNLEFLVGGSAVAP